jgi:metal-sulfur cluster biosynthetic enzyme
MGPVIAGDVEARVRTVPGVTDVNVELVWDPPWGQAMMSEAAKLQLGLL